MLRGGKVGLRARHDDDIPVLRTELFNDVDHSARFESGPWRPMPPDAKRASPATGGEEETVRFSVVELSGSTLIGLATLWGIDTHNRSAHIGLALLPSARGQGYGTDAVAALCQYAFVVRSLHRLQIETLADNPAMLRAAERNGFVREGVLRSSAWVMGEFLDEVTLGLLVQDWKQGPR